MLPKGCRGLLRTAQEARARQHRAVDRITAACGGSVAGKTPAVLRLTFEPDTDDMCDSRFPRRARVAQLLDHPVVTDLRNIYQPAEMAAAGRFYVSIGRPTRRIDGVP